MGKDLFGSAFVPAITCYNHNTLEGHHSIKNPLFLIKAHGFQYSMFHYKLSSILKRLQEMNHSLLLVDQPINIKISRIFLIRLVHGCLLIVANKNTIMPLKFKIISP
jgi:hypothetical protein